MSGTIPLLPLRAFTACTKTTHFTGPSGVPRNFVGWGGTKPGIFSGGVEQQIQLRIDGRENGDLGVVAPYSGVPLNLQMNETRILISLLRMYIPRNWEFGSALAKLLNFGGGGGGLTPRGILVFKRVGPCADNKYSI
jgi:hypothetical protein